MKITDIITETTSAGAIATVAAPMTKKMQRRMSDASIYGQPKKKKANEGDVVNFPQKKKPKVCSCPYDDEDDTKDLGIDPNCPYHGKK